MKKVGILTFHYVDNYGAVLQAYALRKKINELPECRAEIINYVPPGFAYELYGSGEKYRVMLQKKRQSFEAFLSKYCGVNTPMLSSVEDSGYDYYCVGSDQVWNAGKKGHDPEYFFASLPEEAVKISYAASIGMSVQRANTYREVFSNYLSGFKAVSVREEEHVEFAAEVSGRECLCVVDPTLLLDAKDYEEVVSKEDLREEPFVFFFWLVHDDEMLKGIDFANTISRKDQLPVVHNVADARKNMFHKDGGCMMGEGVENFLWYIKHAKYVVTNSYHASLFSIRFQSPFYIFTVESMRSRIDMLVKKYGISTRIADRYIAPGEINEQVCFEDIEKKIVVERNKSLKYLKHALDIER